MNFDRLEKNLTDMLVEQQAKLGYLSETVRLYYPLHSLNRMLSSDLDCEEMMSSLQMFAGKADAKYGQISISHKGERFCFTLPPAMSDYVHELSLGCSDDRMRFIHDFVRMISSHDCTIESLRSLFSSWSDRVCEETSDGTDFDFVFFFEDGKPDEYRYLIREEGCHLTYHRYTPEDYEELFGGNG